MIIFKFRRKDIVEVTVSNCTGTILKAYTDEDGVNMYLVGFDGGILKEKTYKESELKFKMSTYKTSKILNKGDVGESCPKCKNPWTQTKFGTSIWYDCRVCKDKAENLVVSSMPTKGKFDNDYDEQTLFDYLESNKWDDSWD